MTAIPGAFRADVDVTGEAFVPNIFADDYRALTASLDWARVFEGERYTQAVVAELLAAAKHAENLARECKRLAEIAEARDV